MQTQSIKRNLLPIKQLTDDQLGEKEESSSFQKKRPGRQQQFQLRIIRIG